VGVFDNIRRSVAQLSRTVATSVAVQARSEVAQANVDLLDGESWVSTLDLATCIQCGELDGEVFPVGEGPMPELHPSCRCVRTPIVKSWEALGISGMEEIPPGTRASLDGQVPDVVTWSDWILGQDADVQDEILGSTRGELLRAGGLELDQFVNDAGRILTLEELRALEPDLFDAEGNPIEDPEAA
jgi:hypothetical protein